MIDEDVWLENCVNVKHSQLSLTPVCHVNQQDQSRAFVSANSVIKSPSLVDTSVYHINRYKNQSRTVVNQNSDRKSTLFAPLLRLDGENKKKRKKIFL